MNRRRHVPRQSHRAGLVIAIGCLFAAASCGSSSTTPALASTPGKGAAPPVASAPPVAFAPPIASAPSPEDQLPALGDIPFYRGDVLGQSIDPGPGPSGEPQLAWHASTGASSVWPLLVEALVIGGTPDGAAVAVDARTGIQRWRFKPTGGIAQSIAAADGTVFLDGPSTVYAVDVQTGAKRWQQRVAAPFRGVVVNGTVYVASYGGAVGLSAMTGAVVWKSPMLGDAPSTVVRVADGVAYISAGDGRIYAVDIASGAERWPPVQTISQNPGGVEIVGDTLYTGTVQGNATEPVGMLYAIDRATGTVRWKFHNPSMTQLGAGPVRDGVLYAAGAQDGIYALRDDGSQPTVLWHTEAPTAWFALVLVGDTLYEQRDDGSIGAYAAADGHLLWETPAVGSPSRGLLVSGGMIFAANDTQGLMALADPSLIALLPELTPSRPAVPGPTASLPPDPFSIVRATPWATTGLAIPLGMDNGPDGLLYILDTKPSVTVIDPRDGHVVRVWGRQGEGNGEFNLTRRDDNPGFGDIGVGPDGLVYVADGSNHRVQVFRPDGTWSTSFGSFGTGEGQFGSIGQIAIGADGSVYVTDDQPNPLSKFTSDGKFLWRSPKPAGDPDLSSPLHGIVVRADGSVILDCEGCGHLLVFDPVDGHVRERIPVSVDLGGPIQTDSAGNLFVARSGYDEAELLVGASGRILGGEYLEPGGRITNEGNGHVEWGDIFWPSPVFLPDGRGFSFGGAGLLELKVTPPAP
jgi:outer membrane protein assembly factor BamB